MREFKEYIRTDIALKESSLRLTVTNANHIYVEAQDGWPHRGRRYHYTAHVIFDGEKWVLQPDMGSSAVYCPESTSAGERAMTASVLAQLNAALLGDADFTKLRAQAQEVEANNEIHRAEVRIRNLRDQLLLLESCVTDLEMVEENAKQGSFPKAYKQGV